MNIYIVKFSIEVTDAINNNRELEVLEYRDANSEFIDQASLLFLNKFGYCTHDKQKKDVYYSGSVFLIDMYYKPKSKLSNISTHSLIYNTLIRKMRDDKIDNII